MNGRFHIVDIAVDCLLTFRTQAHTKIKMVDADEIYCCSTVLCSNHSACAILDVMQSLGP